MNENGVKILQAAGYQVEYHTKALPVDILKEKIRDVHAIGLRSAACVLLLLGLIDRQIKDATYGRCVERSKESARYRLLLYWNEPS